MTAAALTETAGRSPQGTPDPRLQLAAGQTVRAIKQDVAQTPCASEPPPSVGSGVAATRMQAIPPTIRMSRPAGAAGRSASPVST
jgi:hypothetical protein